MRKLTQAAGGDFDQGWNFVVLQHTDCGILRMQVSVRGWPISSALMPDSLDAKEIADPRAAVEIDLAALRDDPRLPSGMRCSGYVYDVTTGRIDTALVAQ